jgi:hypothetical protein
MATDIHNQKLCVIHQLWGKRHNACVDVSRGHAMRCTNIKGCQDSYAELAEADY